MTSNDPASSTEFQQLYQSFYSLLRKRQNLNQEIDDINDELDLIRGKMLLLMKEDPDTCQMYP